MSFKRELLGSVAAICVVASVSGASAAHARTINSAGSGSTVGAGSGITEIVVTAQKRQQKLMNVGITVTSVTSRQLQNAGVTDISHLSNVVSGFHVSYSYDNLPTFSIRGLGFTSNQLGASPTVSAYVDEAPLPYSGMTGDVTLDLARVEVLKGPQGTLFGNNSTGGSINFIAAKPTDVLSAGITTTGDRFGQFSAESFVSGPITPTLKARLAVSTTQGGAWQHTYTAGPYLTNGSANKGAERLLLEWRPRDDLKISFNENAYYNDSQPQLPQLALAHPSAGPGSAYVDPTYGSIVTYPLPPHSDAATDFPAPGSEHELFYQGVLRADYSLTDAITLTSLTDYAHYRESIERPYDGVRINLIDGGHDGTIQTYGQEFRGTGDFKDIGLNLTAGANYSYDTVTEEEPYYFIHFSGLPTDFTLNQAGKFTSQTTAGFADAEWKATKQVSLIAGIRATQDHQTDYSCLPGADAQTAGTLGFLSTLAGGANAAAYKVGECDTIGPAPGFLPFTYHASSTDRNVSWRGGVNFQVTPDALVYALVSRGYKAGGYPFQLTLYSNQIAKVAQEKVTSFEGGVKYSYHHRLNVTAAYYYYDYLNKQVFADQPGGPLGPDSVLANIPVSKAYGFDAEATYIPIDGLTLHAAMTYTRTAVTNAGSLDLDSFGNPINYVGRSFPYAPRLSSVFDVQYRHRLTDQFDAFVGASGNYQGSQTGDLSGEAPYAIPAYATFDARIGVQTTTGWTATIWVRNLFNRYYWTDTNFGGDAYIHDTGMPRNVGVTVSYKF